MFSFCLLCKHELIKMSRCLAPKTVFARVVSCSEKWTIVIIAVICFIRLLLSAITKLYSVVEICVPSHIPLRGNLDAVHFPHTGNYKEKVDSELVHLLSNKAESVSLKD